MRTKALLCALVALAAAFSALPGVPASSRRPHGDHKHPHPVVYKALYKTALLNGYGGVQT
jgi:hypothetical protein